jgi:uncharacterized protein (TIGR02118 family)
MHRLLVLYPTPIDPDHFRRHYESVHVPLAKNVPGIREMRYGFDAVTDGEGLEQGLSFFCVFEATWDDERSMVDALASPEGQAVVADVANYATGGFLRLHYELEERP